MQFTKDGHICSEKCQPSILEKKDTKDGHILDNQASINL
jgi:predicted nucleic acid-binding Zn ribbon protein